MKNVKQKLYYLPPAWGLLIVFSVCAVLFGLFIKYDIQSVLAIYTYFHIPALFLSCIFAILATVNYSFYSDCLEVRVLLFTIRRVYWKDVTGAMYFSSLSGKCDARPYLIICVAPCQPVNQLAVSFEKYEKNNLKYLLRIPISGKETEVFKLMEALGIEVKAVKTC